MTAQELMNNLSKIKDKENTDIMLNVDGLWTSALYTEYYSKTKNYINSGRIIYATQLFNNSQNL